MSTRTLYLIRHGKAEDHSFSKRDYDRNLVDKGKVRSRLIGLKLKHQLTHNNTLLISSSANRALQTAEIFCDLLNYHTKDIQLEKSIYEAYFLEILKAINKVPNDIDTVLIFGHNPGLSDLTNYLCDSYIDLKTSHIAKIILPEGFNFSEVSGSTCQLETVITE
ncbi:SixA phosphatase family protein [Sphingobacterium bovistauri]|uniref:Histidine phosphatase family protein n=1 Tax=Sphingobacterium bovistauri TaxID=2781959 RepID=A0ABS7ZCB4_9SPHI|nr:histidine phosphatase family protein [Sphingobacterium bovistauri]MCA5006520.1 histidine phosphatase family protein [Sphingobacterium bovistauri]